MPDMRAYNPSIMRFPDGVIRMTYRRHGLADASAAIPGDRSEVVICDLDEQLEKPTNHRVISGMVGPNSEDARLFMHAGVPQIAYTAAEYRKDAGWICHLECGALAPDGSWDSVVFHRQTDYGVNRIFMEKNWSWFSDGTNLRFVYSIAPLVVFDHGSRNPSIHRHMAEWVFGVPHGGTPPIWADGLWISFCHSYRICAKNKRQYFLGAYAFDSEMKLQKFTRWPIMAGSEAEGFIFNTTSSTWHPTVVFPCGAIFEKDMWTVSIGVNDSWCGMIQFHRDWLNTLLQPVPVSG